MRWNRAKTYFIMCGSNAALGAVVCLLLGRPLDGPGFSPLDAIPMLILGLPAFLIWDAVSSYRERRGLWTPPHVARRRALWAGWIGLAILLAFFTYVQLPLREPGKPPTGIVAIVTWVLGIAAIAAPVPLLVGFFWAWKLRHATAPSVPVAPAPAEWCRPG